MSTSILEVCAFVFTHKHLNKEDFTLTFRKASVIKLLQTIWNSSKGSPLMGHWCFEYKVMHCLCWLVRGLSEASLNFQ